ncbi:histidine phosphatase family protein [Mobilitalea sibirica]|uniref:Histidine phosphatase family protein n=1 Tax=Mobilitalea sibirica TaxID=1462919 RepID=A0A8J7KW38_9FIRM|nr:histidine phosphatase family protein [Mobilitalea sibirica]MBH1940900.1 histidine phosphatase family protein [Mobilitalea sibirica]
MSKLYVVRHGETDFNIQGKYAGSTDVELNEIGENQAKVLAETFVDKPINIIMSSTLKRAMRTATIIAERIGKEVVALGDFVERNVGLYEGLTREEVSLRYPDLWNQNVLRLYDCNLHKGESMRQVRERVYKGLEYIKDTYKGCNIILVTHGYVSREIYGYFNKLSEEKFNRYVLNNCQVAEYDME